jgi:hypothetical protein
MALPQPTASIPSLSCPRLPRLPAPPACSVAFAQARDAEYEAAQRILREEGLKVPVDLEFDFDR